MEEVKFTNSLGKVIRGTYYKGGKSGIILVHGFTGDRHEWGKFDLTAKLINKEGFSVLTFDFTGCGESDDELISVEREIDDLNCAINFFMLRGIEKIGLLGYSLGGLVSCYCYSEHVKTIVFWAPSLGKFSVPLTDDQKMQISNGFYTRTRDKGVRNLFKIDAKYVDERLGVDQKDILKNINCPVLIIQGDSDDISHVELSRTASKVLENCTLEIFEDGHKFEKTYKKVAEFSAKWFKEHIDL